MLLGFCLLWFYRGFKSSVVHLTGDGLIRNRFLKEKICIQKRRLYEIIQSRLHKIASYMCVVCESIFPYTAMCKKKSTYLKLCSYTDDNARSIFSIGLSNNVKYNMPSVSISDGVVQILLFVILTNNWNTRKISK